MTTGNAPAPAAPTSVEEALCPSCGRPLRGAVWDRYRVCEHCRYHAPLTAFERVSLLTDADSFQEINQSLVSPDPLVFNARVSYGARLKRARQETGLNEAVLTGTGRVNGRDCVLAVFDIRIMGGSMGSDVGE